MFGRFSTGAANMERLRSRAVVRGEGGTTREDQMSTPVQAHRLVSSDRVIGTDVYGVSDEAIGQIDHLSHREGLRQNCLCDNELWRLPWARP